MSRASESEHATSHAAHRGPPSADLDAEHDPEVSRRASLAGLHREIGLSAKSGAHQGIDVHGTAEHRSLHAVRMTLQLTTARIRERALAAQAMRSIKLNEAGMTPHVQALSEMFDEVKADLEQVSGLVMAQNHVHRRELGHEVTRLEGAYEIFMTNWSLARSEVGQHDPTKKIFDKMFIGIDALLAALCASVGVDATVVSDRSRDPQSVETLSHDAIQLNLTALKSWTDLLRTGPMTLDDLGRMFDHLEQLELLLEQDRSAKSWRSLRPEVRSVMRRVKGLYPDVCGSQDPKINGQSQKLQQKTAHIDALLAGGR